MVSYTNTTRMWRWISGQAVPQDTKYPQQKLSSTVFDQWQSPLIRLPLELREMIWKEVLMPGVMHITHLPDSLGHARCTDEAMEKWDTSTHDCWGKGCCISAGRNTPSLYAGPIYGVEKPASLLGLFMTCRLINLEAKDFLYTSYTFDFRYPHTLKSFCETVPRAQLNLIRSVQMTCDFWDYIFLTERPHHWIPSRKDDVFFEDTCRLLSTLASLKELRIEHRDRARTLQRSLNSETMREIKGRVVKMLKTVEQTQSIEFKGLWSEGEVMASGYDISSLPFKVVGV